MADHLISFTEQELADLWEAVRSVSEQTRGLGPESFAQEQRWAKLADRLESYRR